MNSLLKYQTQFVDALYADSEKSALGKIRADGLTPEQRLAIYQNNTFTNLRGALQAVYPVIFKLVGEPFFNHAADAFIRSTPSTSGDLHDYGEAFADFMAAYQPAKKLVYLPGVAKLEWAYHRAFHAADHNGIDMDKLGQVPPETYGELKFILHPVCFLLASKYPTMKIWQVNQDDYAGDQSVDLEQGGNYLLLSREENYVLRIEAIARGDFEFLRGFTEGKNLEAAAELALQADKKFNLAASLQRYVAQKIMVDFSQ